MREIDELNQTITELKQQLHKKDKIIDALKERVAHDINQAGTSFGIFENNLLLQTEVEKRTKELSQTLQEVKKKDELLLAQSRTAAMGEMISMIAHQWRQPLSLINVETHHIMLDIELGELNEEVVKEHLTNITKQTAYLSQTIEDFGSFFKTSSTFEEVTPKAITKATLAIIGKSMSAKGITVELDLQTNQPFSTNKNELIQVFINLLNNAKDALLEKEIVDKKIIISSHIHENGHLEFTICDNAGGIPKHHLNKVFDPYFSTKGLMGLGLGLYICQSIVHKHLKGKISVINAEKGACFTMLLPVEELS